LQVFERYRHFFLEYVNLCFTVINKEINKRESKPMAHYIKHGDTYEKANVFHIIIVLLAISQIAEIIAFIVS